jgi:serine protease Do
VTPEIAQSFGLKETTGVLIADVAPGGPAEQAGIERGDVVTAFDGKEVKSAADLPRLVAETPIGKTVTVRVLRKGKPQDITLKVGEMASETAASAGRAPAGRVDLGMNVDNITQKNQRQFQLKDRAGVVVTAVARGGVADQAGIQAGDIVKEVNRTAVRNVNDYRAALRQVRSGASLLLLIKRGDNSFYVTATVP